MKAKLVLWQALTPVHPGTGQASESVVDLPVAREKATGFPVIPASSLKGVLRDGRKEGEAERIFGSEERAAELTLTDARILLLAVRSHVGTFALITSPTVLGRLRRDLEVLGLPPLKAPLPSPGQAQVLLPKETGLVCGDQVSLEDLDLEAIPGGAEDLVQELARWVGEEEAELFRRHLAVVSDEVFGFFCEMGLEVIPRVRLKAESKTVEEGPWYEEAIPAESVFYCFALAPREEAFQELDRPYLQVGGQGSVGRGLLRRLASLGG